MMLREAASLLVFAVAAVVAQDDTNRNDSSGFDSRKVLLNLFQATGGFDWTDSTNWFQQRTDACDWKGIVCYSDTTGDSRRQGEIQEISLTSNHLVGTVPAEVFELPYLESLNIQDNADVTVDFTALSKAQFLTHLDISKTRVDNIDNIGDATNLEVLHATGLKLKGPIPSSLFNLSKLQGLFANDNSFTGSLPAAIGSLTSLRDVYLYGSDLNGQLPDELGSLTLLEVLTLANNAFGGNLPQNALNSLTNLQLLAIQRGEPVKGDGISGAVPAFDNHPKLTALYLENQRLSGSLDQDFLGRSPAGETIEADLSSNQISGAVPDSLNDKKYLTLYLADNQVTSVSSQLFDRNSNTCPNLSSWMAGDVIDLGCDSFLCPPGTWAPEGRTTRDDSCASCSDDNSIWGRTSCASSSSPDVQERQILVNVYNVMNGRNWKSDTNWLSLDMSVCNWYGISCTNGQVSSINLRNNGLSGTPPQELFSLSQLQTLNLESNPIDFSFQGIGSLNNLQTLNLANTNLPSSALSNLQELASLNSLRILSLESNNLGGPIPGAVFDITSLEELSLDHNDFTGTLDTRVGQLTRLQRFTIDGNQFTGQFPTQIGNLASLQDLDAGENQFGGTLPTELNKLISLRSLSLQQAVTTGGIRGPLLSFRDLEQLTTLQLGSNQLTGTLPADLLTNNQNLGAEITLGLSDNVLNGEVPSQWSRFDILFVDLAGNRITTIASSLCQTSAWMGGDVGTFSCDAILCPQGTSNSIGRKSDAASSCDSCSNGGTNFLGAKSCSGQTPTFGNNDGSQIGILSDFFDATLGSGWKRKSGWFDSTDTCSFYGVECDGGGRVIRIDLRDNGLQGTVPGSIFKLPQLNELILSKNSISVDFDGIDDSSTLTTLELDSTNLDSIAGLGGAPNLVSLHLADNHLEGDIPNELFLISSLRELDLGYNQLSGKIQNLIGFLTSLETLRLYHNQFTGRLPATLGDLTNLRELNLAENNFDGSIPVEFNDLTNLRFLSLQREGGITGTDDVGINHGGSSNLGAGLTGPLPSFDKLSSITSLYLGVNNLSGSIPFNFLDGVSNTQAEIKVDLTGNQLTGTIPGSLTQFQKMSLFAADNELTGIAQGLCARSDWLEGYVGQYQCDGILCPIGTYNSLGRKGSGATTCQACSTGTNGYLGSFECLSSAGHAENSERDILEKLYREMNGSNWLDNTGWMDSDQSICTWFGIECISDDTPSVVSISLENNRLLNSLVTDIYSLPNLATLNLQNNDIEFSFNGIQNANSLEYLDVAETGLTSLVGVSSASGLKLLRAHGNSLTVFPTEVFSLASIEILSLSDNAFPPQAVPANVQSFANIRYFACGNCGFTGTVPTWLGLLANLEFLRLDQNALTGSLPVELLQLNNAKHIDLSDQTSNGGGLTGSLLDFSTQTQLTELYLQHNSFQGAIPATMLQSVSTSELVTLDLRYNFLTGAVPTGLVQFSDMNLLLAANSIDSLQTSLCNLNWNDGNTATHGCDGILCAKGSFNAFGRAIESVGCAPCTEDNAANVLGSIYCGSSLEHSALITIYSSTGGPSWNSDSNWLKSEDHCTWEGITCHQSGGFQGLVQKIELEQNNLFGTADLSQVWQLVGLEKINLQKNDIIVPFTGIGNAINLQSIILSETKTTSLFGISGATTLKELHLTNSELQGPVPDELFDLLQLEKLYLSDNKLGGTLSTLIGRLRQLQDFYIFQNELMGQLPTELGLLDSIEHLSLGKNKFTGTIPRQVGSLPQLQVLSMEKEEDAPPDSMFSVGGGGLSGTLPALDGLPNIRELYLGHNSFTGTIPSQFLQGVLDKTSILTVDLSYNNIVGSIPSAWSLFGDLKIQLGRNQISGIPEEVCGKTAWFNGEVANGCDAILCPPGSYNEFGRRVDSKTICLQCTYPGSAVDYGSVNCGPVAADLMDDRAILLELYDAAGGNEWSNSADWTSSSVSFCEWFGVTCEPEGEFGQMAVTAINLQENNLNGVIPSILFHLPELRKLDVRNNGVQIGLNAIFQAEHLEELYLDKTLVSSLQGIGQATSLRVLHLHRNSFGWESIPDELFDLVELEELNLSDSMFGGSMPTGIGKLVKLQRFSVVGNALSGQIPSEIGNLSAVEELDLSNNNWFGTLPESINGLNSLKALFLNNGGDYKAGISGQLRSFANMPSLRDLHLSNNQFTGSIPSDFLAGVDDKTDLVTVYLNQNHLVGTIPSAMTAFSQLNIYLEDNLLTGFGDGICQQSQWLDGNVGRFGCDAILCPVGLYSPQGRQVSDSTACEQCPDSSSSYLGSSFCLSIQKQKERGILEQLFQSTGGNSWKNQDGWMDDAFDICSWYGIKCKEGSTIESILLGGNHLVGTIPTAIYELPNLKFLWVYSNPVEIRFEGLAQATSLTSLLLDATKLRSLDGIGMGQSLVDIDVRFNNLQGDVPVELSNLLNLESLIISENDFSGKVPELITLRKLSTLRMSNNRFTGTMPAFAQHPALLTLDLSQNSLVGSIPSNTLSSVSESQKVFLDLSDNRLTGTIPGELSRFADLTIYLRNNRIEGINPTLCDQNKWNGGDVGSFKCDGILCPSGTYSDTGRASRTGATCEACSQNSHFGGAVCGSSASRLAGAFGLLAGALLFTTSILWC